MMMDIHINFIQWTQQCQTSDDDDQLCAIIIFFILLITYEIVWLCEFHWTTTCAIYEYASISLVVINKYAII